jgi:pimeloyl-ACP methyl ester carboxylesterase
MKLAYRVVEADKPGLSAVLVHGQGAVPVDRLVEFARRSGLNGSIVVPFGDYATTSSGMEVGGPCWYRSLPGDAGTDPLTLTRAVVQVADLLAEVGLDRPVLVGWRQGAAVALGAALLAPMATGGVVAVDVPSAHLHLLPASLTIAVAPPPVLLATSGAVDDTDPVAALEELARRGMKGEVVRAPEDEVGGHSDGGAAPTREDGEAVIDAVGHFVRAASGREVAEGSAP